MTSDLQLCPKCGGNGVLKIPNGISTCSVCDGRCWVRADEDKSRHIHSSAQPESAVADLFAEALDLIEMLLAQHTEMVEDILSEPNSLAWDVMTAEERSVAPQNQERFSECLGANADAMRFLARFGRCEITEDWGRRVYGILPVDRVKEHME